MLSVEYISPDGVLLDLFEMADGMTVEQAARTLFPDEGGKFPAPTIAIVGAKPAVKSLGDWDCPLAETRVQFRQLAMGGGGGGSNAMQMVLQLAIVAAAITASVLVPGMGAFAGGALVWGMGGAAWGAIASTGIMLLGTLLIGALFQNKLPQGQAGAMSAEQASPTYNINSSGNQARLYQVEPELMGRMKIVPDFVANTWTEYVDNDQIGYFVYALGRGYYEVESLQFGETVFWRDGQIVEDSGYDVVDIEFVEPDNPVTIFPDNVVSSSEVNGQQLFAPNEEEYDGGVGPYVTNPPGTFTNKLMLDFVFQQGIGHYAEDGELEWMNVYWTIEAQKIDDFGSPLGDWFTLEAIQYGGRTLTPQRITRVYNVENGRYWVRARRDSNHFDDRSMDAIVWAGMRAMLPGAYRYPISCIALAVRANNALTQSASRKFSAIATRKLPHYDRKTKRWSEPKPTRSWAAAISHVCKCEWGGKLTDADIDLDTLWAIDERLQRKGWFFDAYYDGPYLVWTLLCEMCQAACVIPRLIGPVLSFIEDAPDRLPVFALTPRNIVRGSFAINYATWTSETPDDVTVEYLDADYGFQQRDVTARLPESESKEPTSLDILGITNRDHAHKVAVAYAAHNRWQRISVEAQVEALGRVINRGDVCTVAHPRFKNTCAGAVDSWSEEDLRICVVRDFNWPRSSDGYYLEINPRNGDEATLESLVHYGIKGASAGKAIFADEDTLFLGADIPSSGDAGSLSFDGWFISLTRPDGSLWGPCKIKSIKRNNVYLDGADYSTLLLQGHGNPFEWLSSGVDRQPTTWTLYTGRVYQRLMVVDSVSSQDALHYNLKLLNYDQRIYQYGDLPAPIWQGRGQLPTADGLAAPSCVRGVVETDTAVTLVWLAVEGASWYEVQTSTDGQSWSPCGRFTETNALLLGDPGAIFARVRAGNDKHVSAWSQWRGNTTAIIPDTPIPRLDGTYDGSATIVWPKVKDAENYVVTLRAPNGIGIYTAETTATTFEVTPEIQTGGPYRALRVEVAAKNEAGVSVAGKVELALPSLPAPQRVMGLAQENAYFLLSVEPAYADATGYVVVFGAESGFGTDKVSSVQKIDGVASLPKALNFTRDAPWYRVAYKDAFWENCPDYARLVWSGSYLAYTTDREEDR